MIGLLIIGLMASLFYKLADAHGRNKWLFAILSILVFYATQFISGFIWAILDPPVAGSTNFTMLIVCLAISAISVAIFYQILKSNWTKNPITAKSGSPDLLDDITTNNEI